MIKKFLIAVISFVFVGFISLFLFWTGIERTLLDDDFYEDLFEETQVGELINKNIDQLVVIEGVSGEPEQDIINGFRKTFNQTWIKETGLVLAQDILVWFEGDQPFSLEIDLQDRREIFQQHIKGNQTLPNKVLLDQEMIPFDLESGREKINLFRSYFSLSYFFFFLFALLFCFLLGILPGIKKFGLKITTASLIFFIPLYIFRYSFSFFSENPEMESVISFFINRLTFPSLLLALGGLVIFSLTKIFDFLKQKYNNK